MPRIDLPNIALPLALAAALVSLPPVSAGAAGNYDGTWSVVLVTDSGMCDARYAYSLSVQGGQVRPITKADSSSATLSGRVGADGSVGLNVATSAASGSASGRLQSTSGSGTWQVASLCSGRWTAKRNNTKTAQID